jgi:type IV secretory pathway VirB2 component (pilin)
VPFLLHITRAVRRRDTPDEHASGELQGTECRVRNGSSPRPHPAESPAIGGHERGATSLLMHTLFAVVALLLIADWHSSYLASSAQWETNPFMTVLAEHVGPRAALVGIKAVDFMCLAGMYALWRRSRAHVVIAVALSTAAFVYVDIVLNNYSS